MQPELIADFPCETGEGPLWHPDEKRVYWVDIPNGHLYRYDPATGNAERCFEHDGSIGGFTIQEDGSLLLFMGRGAIKAWRDGRITGTVFEEYEDEVESRFNDVIADPVGRVYCGTMPCGDRLGRLWRLDPDGTMTRLLEGIGCANGMGYTPDRRRMYFVDSPTRNIYLFDYEQATGAITNQRIFVTTPEHGGFPDGMTVDAEGFVWCAKWGGSALMRYAPDGTLDREYRFPAPEVSSVTFGGDDYTDIYVTTASGHQRDVKGPLAGSLFRLNVGIRSVPEFRSRIRV
jgi:sugar lactone lactonase YvrE